MDQSQELGARAFEAIALARADDLAALLTSGAPIESTNGQGFGLLTMAAGLGRQREVALLLAQRAQVDRLDGRGYTPMMYAAVKGHDEVIKLLLDADAKPDLASPGGLTALMFAASEGHSLAVRVLLERGADITKISGEGRTALHYAVADGHTACVRRLVAARARADITDKAGATPLALAVQRGYYDIVELLGGTRPSLATGAATTPAPGAATAAQSPAGDVLRQAFGGVDPALKMLEDLARQAQFPGGVQPQGWSPPSGLDAFANLSTTPTPAIAAALNGGPMPASMMAPPAANSGTGTGTGAPAAPAKELKEEDFIGQKAAKDALRQVISVAKLNQERAARKLPKLALSLNAAFTGGPGTGKTSFARLYAQEIRKLGVLPKGQLVEASRADLVGEYKGQTPQKTRAVIERAKGGVLVIDDAHNLKSGDEDSYGQECIDTLARAMEELEGQLVVVLAGPARETRDFLHRQASLKARIPNVVPFADFTDDELGSILDV